MGSADPTEPSAIPRPVPRVEAMHVRNYRVLRDLELSSLTPLTVLLGPNGSGKSTIFDVFAFLSECFSTGLRRAWDRRGRFKELRSRGAEGPITIEVKYREAPKKPIITYHIEIDEGPRGPIVSREWLRWKRGSYGAPFRFLDFHNGEGQVTSGENPDPDEERIREKLTSTENFAVSTLGQLAKHPRVSALRRFITGWYLSYLSSEDARGTPEAGPRERLSQSGDNLPNVIQYYREQHPEHLETILTKLTRRIPQLERVDAKVLDDGRLLLQLKDAPFEQPILSKYSSDGTLKLLSYLVVLYDPDPPPLIGIEEPENFLYPKLLYELAEECQLASSATQIMATSHSPYFVDGLDPAQVWALSRDAEGYVQARRASEMPGIAEFIAEGAKLGQLWMEGHFAFASADSEPLAPSK